MVSLSNDSAWCKLYVLPFLQYANQALFLFIFKHEGRNLAFVNRWPRKQKIWKMNEEVQVIFLCGEIDNGIEVS